MDSAEAGEIQVAQGTEQVAGCGAQVAAIAVAMRQGTQWQARLRRADGSAIPVVAAYDCPRMERRADGWWPEGL